MKILGIDPGMAIVGYGLIETVNDSINLLTSGSIQTDKKLPDSKRLLEIYNDLTTVVQKYQPDCASVEELFFFKNQISPTVVNLNFRVRIFSVEFTFGNTSIT